MSLKLRWKLKISSISPVPIILPHLKIVSNSSKNHILNSNSFTLCQRKWSYPVWTYPKIQDPTLGYSYKLPTKIIETTVAFYMWGQLLKGCTILLHWQVKLRYTSNIDMVPWLLEGSSPSSTGPEDPLVVTASM